MSILSLQPLPPNHIHQRGEDLFERACREDLQGIVTKWKDGRHNPERQSRWIKITNPAYTRIVGRQDLFQKKSAVGNLHLRREANIEAIS